MHEPLLVPRASYGLKDGVLRLTLQQNITEFGQDFLFD